MLDGHSQDNERALDLVISDLIAEVERQDRVHPAGYPATRDGIRLGVAVAQDELDETLGAWREDRCKCPTPLCDHAKWEATAEEAVQAAAILVRTLRSISELQAMRHAAKVAFWGAR